MPNIGPTQMLIGFILFIAVVAAVYLGVKLAMRGKRNG
jgi:hypothetical protein